jgi:hypothetical protein
VVMLELQIAAPAFLALQREALRSRQFCLPAPVLVGGHSIGVEQIEFNANSLRHDVPATFAIFHQSHGTVYGIPTEGFATQVAQATDLHVVSMADVLGRPNAAPATVHTIPLTVVFTIHYYALNGRCFLHTSFDHIEWGSLPSLPPGVDADDAKAAITQMLQGALASKAVPLNFAGALSEGRAEVENAGVTVDKDLQRVVFRATTGGATSYADVPWGNFFRGFVLDRTAGADWAFFVSKGTLESSFTTRMDSALRQEDLPSELHVISVGSTYSNAGGRGSVETVIYANVDLPDPLGTSYVTPTVRTVFSVETHNTLDVDVFLPDVKDVAAQAVGVGVMVAGKALLGPLWDLLLGGISGAKVPTVPLPNCREISALHQRCSLQTAMPSFAGVSLRFDSIAALPDGIALTGPVRTTATTRAGVATTFHEFAWTPPDVSCGSAGKAMLAHFMADAWNLAPMRARVFVDNTGTAPAYLCRVETRNDPRGLFPASAVRYTPGLLPAEIVVTIPNPDYGGGRRYPLDLLVTTTAGSRLVRIPAAPELTQADVDRLTALLLVSIGDCMQLVAPWFEYPRGFNPLWHVDPPPWEANVQHLWDIDITGLRPEQTVSLADAAGLGLVTTLAGEAGLTHLTALTSPSAALELTLLRDTHRDTTTGGETVAPPDAAGSAPAAAGSTARPRAATDSRVREWLDSDEGIDVRQRLLVHTASVGLSGRCRALHPVPAWARHGVAAVVDDGLEAFDVSSPHRPVPLGSWSVPGIRGAVAWGGRLLTFGSRGLTLLTQDDVPEPLGDPCHSIHDVVVAGAAVYVLTGEALETRDDRLCLTGRTGIAGGRTLVRLGRHVVVGGSAGLRVYGVTDGADASPVSEMNGLDVDRLTLPPEGRRDSALAVLTDGSARLVALRDGRLGTVATYERAPWFAASLSLGDVLVQIGESGRNLDVGVLGDAHLTDAGPNR